MAIVIRELAAKLSLQADTFSNGVKAIQREAKELEKSLKPIKDAAKDIGTGFAAVGGTVVASLGAMVKSAADYSDAIRDASIRTGVGTEALSGLKFAAEQSGTSFDAVNSGLKFLAKNAVEAAEGSKEQAQTFKSLGISATDVAGKMKPTGELFSAVAERMSHLKDGAQKTALMLKVFGKSGVELTEVMNLGAAGIAAAQAEAARFGLTVGAVAAAEADAFNDELKHIQQATQGLSNTIGKALIPILTDAARAVTETIIVVRQWADEHQNLIKGVGALAVGLTGAGGLLLGLSGLLAILPKLKVAFALLTSPVGLTAGAFVALAAGVIYFRKEIAIGLTAALATVVTGFEVLADWAQKVAVILGDQGLVDKLQGVRDASLNFRKGLDDLVVAGMAEVMTLDKTAVQLMAEKEARLKSLETKKEDLAIIGKVTAALQKMRVVNYDLTANLAVHQTREHQMFEATRSEVDQTIAKIKEYYGWRVDLENRATDELLDGLKRTTDARVREILKGRAEDQRNWEEQAAILEKRMADAVASVKNSAGAIFDAMFLKGENVFTSLQKMLKGGALSLGRSIFQDITAQLLGPIKLAFDNFFKGLLKGSGLNGFIQGLGAKLGGALSGLLGIGGSAAPALAGGFLPVFGGAGGAAAGAGAAGTGGGAMAAAGAFATNPITIAVAGAIVAGIAWSKSQAHHEARTFTDTMQDPFANDKGTGVINNIVDAFNAAAAAGALTKTQATEARTSVEELWDTFKEQTAEFAKGGSDEALVARQALATLTPLMTQILTDMSSTISTLADDTAALSLAAQALADDLALTQGFIDQVVNAGKGASNLNTALAALEGIGSTQAIILDRLGSDIQSFYDILVKAGLPVPELIEKYRDLMQIHEAVAITAERVVRATSSGPTGSLISVDSAAEIREFLQALGVGGGQPIVVQTSVNVDGRQVATAVTPHLYSLSRNLGQKISGTR